MKQKTGRKLLGVLLTLVMVIGLMPGMSLTALAATNTYTNLIPTDSDTDLSAKQVTFNGIDWYVIKDESTAADAGTVTLFAKDPLSASVFDLGTPNGNGGYTGANNKYSSATRSSTVKGELDALTAGGGSFEDVAYVIQSVDLTDVDVTGAKLWLLSADEASALPVNIRKCAQASDAAGNVFWLRTPGNDTQNAAGVFAGDGNVIVNGYMVGIRYGVRPALKLDLSKVTFDSATNTFSLAPVSYRAASVNAETHEVTFTDASCAEYTVVSANTTDFEDGKWYVVTTSKEITQRITVSGTANLILVDGETLTATKGITVTTGNALNIYAQSEDDAMGRIIINGVESNAGIGGNSAGGKGGNITINGGNINVTGGTSCAGIGGGMNGGDGGELTINGGIVTAVGGSNAAGIGGGSTGGEGGELTINGGIVTAVGGSNAAGIGGGGSSRSKPGGEGGTVTINGGTVNATGGGDGAMGIGGGKGNSDHGTLKVAASHAVYSNDSAITDTNKDSVKAKAQGKGDTALNINRYRYMLAEEGHVHEFTYAASGATITATCGAANCGLTDSKATLTIVKPTLETYGQTGKSEAATLDGVADFNTATGLSVADTAIKYYKATKGEGDAYTRGDEITGGAPTGAGVYMAEITLSGVKTAEGDDKSVAASVDYSIKYAVTFNTNGGSAVPQQLVEAGESATRPTDPTKEGNIFGGWFADADFAESYNFDEVTENTTVYAKWGEHRVTWTVGRFSLQDVFTGNAPAADSNTTVNMAAESLKPDGATLSWKTETDASGNVTYTAQFSFSVTLHANDGTINAGNVASYIYGTGATLPTDVTREGYAFGGWYDNSGLTGTAVTQISATDTGNKEYWAKWNQAVSYTVTFKVVNGKWDDNTGADKTVTLSGYEGNTLKLTADQIPAVGTKPNDTYKAGSWDVTPSADTAITEATTYTYTYVAKEASVVTKAPEAKTLTYNGSAQELVTAGEATGGEMQYALGTDATTAPADNLYTTSIPTATDAGTYYVWYKVVGDENHLDTAAACVTVTIASADSGSGSPEEGALVYNGSAQELVKGGSAVGGTLKYALGSNAAQAPQDGWSEDVPEGTDAGTYYVWYRVDGDANHNGTAPACVTVTILKAPAPGTVEEKQKASALAPVYNGKAQALVRAPGSLPEGYTKTRYSTNNGKSWSDALPKGTKAGSYSVLVKYVGDKNHTAFTYGPLRATIAKAKITIAAQNKKTTRGKALAKLTYKVSGAYASGDRLGIKLSTTAKKTAKAGEYPISVTWNKNPNYSATIKKGTYTLADAILSTEKKAAKIRINAGLNVDWDGSGVLVKWGDTPDAESYEVWGAYCGKNSPSKKIGTAGAGKNSFRFTSLGKKELNPKKSIKVTVLAYRKVNGKKTKIANTITAHAVIDTNPVYSNAAKITLTRTKYSLKAGKKARIKAGEILADKKKKSLGKGHALTFRYASSKDSVATVDKNGTITAVGRGTCTVYVYARNGRARRISVTVK